MDTVNFLILSEFSLQTGYTEDAVYQKRSKSNWKIKKITLENIRGLGINIYAYNQWCCSGISSWDLRSVSKNKIQFTKKSVFLKTKQINESFLKRLAKFANVDIGALLVKAPDQHILVNIILFESLVSKLNERLT